MLSINKRSVSGKNITGVQRYVYEIEKFIDTEDVKSIYSPPAFNSGMMGYVWEQLVLPIFARGVLWSPANIGPIIYKNQILTIHDISPIEHPEWFSKKYVFMTKLILPLLSVRVRHIITVSEYSKERIVKCLKIRPEKISVIPLGVDSRFIVIKEQEKAAIKKKLNLPNRFVLSLGSVEPRKNIQTLLASWQQWDDRPLDLKLVIAGGSSKIFSNMNLRDSPDDVIFTGRIDEEDLPSLYAAAEIFVYPSLYEGFGLPPLEAMSCGVPVITSNSTSLPEVVGNAAILIDPLNIDEITEAMKRIITNKILAEDLISKGIIQSRKFSWKETAEKTLEVIKFGGKRDK